MFQLSRRTLFGGLAAAATLGLAKAAEPPGPPVISVVMIKALGLYPGRGVGIRIPGEDGQEYLLNDYLRALNRALEPIILSRR